MVECHDKYKWTSMLCVRYDIGLKRGVYLFYCFLKYMKFLSRY